MVNAVMNAKDTLSGKAAECFVTIDGNRYNFMHMKNLEVKIEKKKAEIPILGRMSAGNKSLGWSGSASGTVYYNSSVMRELLLKYKNTGEDTYFEVQITNEDKTSAAGRQTVILKDCNTDGGILAKFDADSDALEEDIEFTFDDFEMPEKFTNLSGML